jgi:hypothetical protein
MPHIEFVNNVLVQNSISAVSGVFADTLNAKNSISSPDLNQLKSASGNWNSTYTTVSSNSSNWQSVYNTFKSTSGSFLTTETDSQTLSYNEPAIISISNGNTVSLSSLDVRSLSSNWQSSYSTVNANSASWGSGGSDVTTLSSNWQNTYATVSSNSGNWDYQGIDLKALSGNWESTYNTFKTTSATFLTTETDSQTLSFDSDNKQLSISNGNTVSLSALDVTSLSTNWENTYSTVNANSATTWAYQGADLKALSSNWENTYSTVSTNSAAWSANPQVIEATVFNADTVPLVRGNVVYSFGATGSTMSVKLASNTSDTTSSKTLGIVNGNIAVGGTGTVTVMGRMDNLNFGAPFVDGDALWLNSTPGVYTNIKPVAPNHGVYLGVVERANSGNGIAYIKVQNGYELNEIHDVLITTPLSGQMLRRNSANTLWVNTDDGTKWDNTFSAVNANSASNWNNDVLKTYTHANFFPISGGTITGNLSVMGDLTYIDTNVSVTSATVIDTNTTTTALRVTQRGTGDSLRVEDEANPDATPLIVSNSGLVGIGTAFPNEKLTIIGNLSCTNIVYANTIAMSTVTFTSDISTSTTSVTATDAYIKVIANGQTKYLRLFDIN